MVNPHLDNGTPWGGSAPSLYERPMRPERPPGQPSFGPHTGYNPRQDPRQDPRPNIGSDRMGIMSQPGGYGSDTYNALVGGMNRQQGRGFDRRKWSSALGHPEMAAVDPSDWRTILKILQAGGDPGTETQTSYNVGDTYPLEGGDNFGYFDDEFAALSGNGGMNNEMLMARLNEYPDYYYNYIPKKYGGDASDVIDLDIGGGSGPSEFPDLADWLQGQGVRT